MKDKILVASWGYSMILTTWVKVIRENPKTLLVAEINSRAATDEECAANGHKQNPGYLQYYSVAADTFRSKNGKESIPFRLYKRGDSYIGTPTDMSSKFYFKLWDGKPQFEDHCD